MQLDEQRLGQKNKTSKLGITFIFYVIVILSVPMSIAAIVNYTIQKNNFYDQLYNKGQSLGKFIALAGTDAVISRDYLLLNQYVREANKIQDVVYCIISSENKQNLTSFLNRSNRYIKDIKINDVNKTVSDIDKNKTIIPMRFPVYAGDVIGYVRLGLSTDRVDEIVNLILIQQLSGMIVIIILLSITIFILFNIKVLKPVKGLLTNIKYVAMGNMEYRVDVTSNNELGTLEKSFNEMKDSLKKINNEKAAFSDQLQDSNKRLELATKAKSAFLANMSHEIRTPLTSIVGFSEEIATNDRLNEEDKKSLGYIVRSGKHLRKVINDILDISKIEAGKMEVENIEFSLFELINDIKSMLSLQAQEKGLDLKIDCTFPLPDIIFTDFTKLKQILINLIYNAIKFTHKGSIHVQVSMENENNKLVISITDTGIGMSEAEVENIFDAFSQADSSTTRKYGGTGLGLSISNLMAEKLGGSLVVNSKPGEGSQFILSVDSNVTDKTNYIYEMPEDNSTEHIISSVLSTPSLTGRILLAEDNPNNQALISLLINKTGAQVDIVENGEQAVTQALAGNYDLVLMDMQMPIMDGLEATDMLRKSSFNKPVIAITANARKEDIDKCKQAGCNDFLSKPIDREAFFQTLVEHLMQDATNDDTSYDELLEDEKQLRKLFVSGLPLTLENINTAFSSGDDAKLAKLMHELKGMGGTFGFPEITINVAELENILRNNQKELMPDKLRELEIKITHAMSLNI